MRILIRLALGLFFAWNAVTGMLTGAVDTYFLSRFVNRSIVHYAADPGLFIFSILGYVLLAALCAVSAYRIATGSHRDSRTGRWL